MLQKYAWLAPEMEPTRTGGGIETKEKADFLCSFVLRTGARPTESVRWSCTGLLNTVLRVLYYVAPRATDTCSAGDTVSPIVGS
jgi:hypothetical protein